MKVINVLGIDLAKDVFQLHGSDKAGRAVLQKQLRRGGLLDFVRKLPPCIIAMEAQGSSHYWGREFIKMGHRVKLIAPQFVTPFVKSNKNDRVDAEAIVEASVRPNMRFVPIKTIEQQEIQFFHRLRTRLVRQRTALSNEVRSFLYELGIAIPKSVFNIRKYLSAFESQGSGLSLQMKAILSQVQQELTDTDQRIETIEKKLKTIASTNELCVKVQKIPGIGVITSTAIVAAAGKAKEFKNGRQFAAWLGLVPRQHSSGGKNILLGISKRGSPYIRSLLVQGARAMMQKTPNKSDYLSRWVEKKRESRGPNKACVALANKNARMAWAMLAKEEEYRTPKAA